MLKKHEYWNLLLINPKKWYKIKLHYIDIKMTGMIFLRRLLNRCSKSMRLVAILAAVLFSADLIITIIASGETGFEANAAGITSSSLTDMRSRAEAIINYEWKPAKNIETWKSALYNGNAYFPAGTVVKGMPYTLFTHDVVSDSLLSLAQYKRVAAKNYSVKTKCRATGNALRTGPVYGSCCATFVSEVLGGSFMSGENPRYDSVSMIEKTSTSSHITNAKASQIKAGDALSISGHIVWVGDVTDKVFVIYEQTPPIAHKVVVKKSVAVNSSGYLVYKGSEYKTITRINVTGSGPSVSAPALKKSFTYYAQGSAPVISWNKIAGASHYLVDVIKDGKTVVSGEPQIDESYTVNLGNGKYDVYVYAVSGSQKAKSNVSTLYIGKLDTPEIITSEKYYPSGSSVTVNWSTCVGATKYRIKITDGEGRTYSEAEVKTNSYTFSPKDDSYLFTVTAVNDCGGTQTAASEGYSFNVGNKRPVIIETSEKYYAHGADVTLNWNDCEGVSDYVLTITSGSAEYLSETVSGGVYFPLHDLPDGSYEAVVSAVESTGEYEWQPSEPFVFHVGRLGKPVVSSSKKYYDKDSTATVTWKECEGATGYHVTVRSADEVITDEDMNATSCSFTVVEGKYTVSVSSLNTNGGSQECRGEEMSVWASSLDIDGESQLMHIGDSYGFKPIVTSADPADSVRWKSYDSRIASVGQDGTVRALGLGTAKIEASVGDMTVTRSIDVVPDLSFEMLGASIRLSDPYGIRFGIRLEKDEAYNSTQIVEYGTLMIASGALGNNELTVGTKNVLKIKAVKTLENDSTHITYTGVLINIPKEKFSTEIVGRGYLVYRGADGKNYTMYSSSVSRSFDGVARLAYDYYSAIEKPNESEKILLKKIKKLLNMA